MAETLRLSRAYSRSASNALAPAWSPPHARVRRRGLSLYVVGPERTKVVDIEFAVGQGRVRPGLPLAARRRIRRREAAFLVVSIRRALNEPDLTVFAMQVEPSVGVADRPNADSVVLPLLLSGGEFDTLQSTRRRSVKKALDFDRYQRVRTQAPALLFYGTIGFIHLIEPAHRRGSASPRADS